MISTAIVSITGSDVIKESKSISPTVLLPQQLGSAYHVKKVSWHLLIVLFLCSEIYTYQMSWIAMTMHQFHLSCRVLPLLFKGSPCHGNGPPCFEENRKEIRLLLNVIELLKRLRVSQSPRLSFVVQWILSLSERSRGTAIWIWVSHISWPPSFPRSDSAVFWTTVCYGLIQLIAEDFIAHDSPLQAFVWFCM